MNQVKIVEDEGINLNHCISFIVQCRKAKPEIIENKQINSQITLNSWEV